MIIALTVIATAVIYHAYLLWLIDIRFEAMERFTIGKLAQLRKDVDHLATGETTLKVKSD